MKRILISSLVLLTLAGCAKIHHPDNSAPANKDLSHEARVEKLVTLDNWDIRGQIGVSDGKEAWSAQVYWQQRGKNFVMQMFGPVAGGSLKVVGKPGKVTLTDSSSNAKTAKSADKLFAEQTGWNLPINSMLYWIKAMPAPGALAEKKFDKYNHLKTLTQQGWNIEYQRYTSDKGVDLPSKITMQHAKLKIKMVISSWKLTA